MNDWIRIIIVLAIVWASYQWGYYKGFNAGEAPWVLSHRVFKNKGLFPEIAKAGQYPETKQREGLNEDVSTREDEKEC